MIPFSWKNNFRISANELTVINAQKEMTSNTSMCRNNVAQDTFCKKKKAEFLNAGNKNWTRSFKLYVALNTNKIKLSIGTLSFKKFFKISKKKKNN